MKVVILIGIAAVTVAGALFLTRSPRPTTPLPIPSNETEMVADPAAQSSSIRASEQPGLSSQQLVGHR